MNKSEWKGADAKMHWDLFPIPWTIDDEQDTHDFRQWLIRSSKGQVILALHELGFAEMIVESVNGYAEIERLRNALEWIVAHEEEPNLRVGHPRFAYAMIEKAKVALFPTDKESKDV